MFYIYSIHQKSKGNSYVMLIFFPHCVQATAASVVVLRSHKDVGATLVVEKTLEVSSDRHTTWLYLF